MKNKKISTVTGFKYFYKLNQAGFVNDLKR